MRVRVLAILVSLALYPLVSSAGEPVQVVVHNTSRATVVVAVAYNTWRGYLPSGTGILIDDEDHCIKGFWRISPGEEVTVLDGGPRDKLHGFWIRILTTEGEWNPSDRASCLLSPSDIRTSRSSERHYTVEFRTGRSKGCESFRNTLGETTHVESYVAQHLLKGKSLRFVWTDFEGRGRKVYRVY